MTQPISTNKEPFTPWHREPWAWYIVGILMVTFAWGSVQLYTAFTYKDSVVIADYYKNGKAINQDMTRIKNARTLGIKGVMSIDELIGEVRLTIRGNPEQSLERWPEQLKLSFLSPAFQSQDKIITLNRSFSDNSNEPVYVGQLEQAVAGRYYLQLETEDQMIPEIGYQSGWKITLEAQVSPGTLIHLKNPEA